MEVFYRLRNKQKKILTFPVKHPVESIFILNMCFSRWINLLLLKALLPPSAEATTGRKSLGEKTRRVVEESARDGVCGEKGWRNNSELQHSIYERKWVGYR